MHKKLKTLVILSGGLDSTVLAFHTRLSEDHELVGCVSVDYGQRHNKELACASQTCRTLGVRHTILGLGNLGFHLGSTLTGVGRIPEGNYTDDSMKTTVVPNRNMILMALAGGVAISVGAGAIAYGAHAGDHAIYPDCRPEFAHAMNVALSLCDWNPPQLIRPFIQLTKADIVKFGVELNVPFAQTWTCYNGLPVACGKCGTCVERLEAFAVVGIDDPLPYQDREFWKTVTK